MTASENIPEIRMHVTTQSGAPRDLNGENVIYVLHIRKILSNYKMEELLGELVKKKN